MASTRQYVETATMTVVFFGVVFLLVVVQQQFGGDVGAVFQPSVVALGLVPIVFYLIATGQLQRFSGAGFELVLRRQAERALDGVGDEEIELVEEAIEMKERLADLYEMDEQNRPTTLAFEIGREGFYEAWAISEYLDVLSDGLNYVLFVDDAGQFEGYTYVSEFESLLADEDVVREIETGDVLARPAVHTAAIPHESSNRAALQEMDRLGVDEVAVLNPNDRFVGVVTQDELVRKLLTEAIREV